MNTEGSTFEGLRLLARLMARRHNREQHRVAASPDSVAACDARIGLGGDEVCPLPGADKGNGDSGIPKKMKNDQ